MSEARPIRVLIVDDSALVRKMLTSALANDKEIEVVGTAPDAYVARDKILELNPDVITLDIEMPRMDGITFLKKLMRYKPLPVIVISSLGVAACAASMEALRAGAVEILEKPNGPASIGDLGRTLAAKIHAAASARPPRRSAPELADPPSGTSGTTLAALAQSNRAPALAAPSGWHYGRNKIIVIGSSTGGPSAVAEVLQRLPADTPPILLVQHMPGVFTRHFAERLNRECHITVKEAEDRDELVAGRALVAPGNFHMTLKRSDSGYRVWIGDGPPVCFSRPSVDVLFSSVAAVAGKSAIGIILTGMGTDGARGLLDMHRAGARTFAQDEASCVVFGMPKEAIRVGAVDVVLPLDRIAGAVLDQLAAPPNAALPRAS